jgi:predicted GNAT superfamily acetyltransferase
MTPVPQTAVPPQTLHQAKQEASAAASRAGVDIRLLHSSAQCQAAADLLDDVWGVSPGTNAVADTGMLVALSHAGNYVGGAFPRGTVADDAHADTIRGMALGFFAEPLGQTLHSHVAGVRRDGLGSGVGAALKLDQRVWCLERGITEMHWTFDPLIARNAYFNFQRLGADCAEYLVNFYGEMTDGVNAGQGSDRMMVSWRLDKPAARETTEAPTADSAFAWVLRVAEDTQEPVETPLGDAAAGSTAAGAATAGAAAATEPGAASAGNTAATTVGVQIPLDIEALRAANPELSARWRRALRAALTGLLETGWTITGVTRSGVYLLSR